MRNKKYSLILNISLVMIIISDLCFASSPIAINIENEYNSINNNLINIDSNINIEYDNETLNEEKLMLIYYQSIKNEKN